MMLDSNQNPDSYDAYKLNLILNSVSILILLSAYLIPNKHLIAPAVLLYLV